MFYSGGFYDAAIHGDKIPADAVEISSEQHATLLAAQSQGKRIVTDESGYPIAVDPPPPTAEQIIAQLTADVQQHMDAAAQSRGYDNIFTACTYAEEPAVPRFQAEGQSFRAWRSQVWDTCYAIMDDVQQGLRPTPTAAKLIAELPTLTLP